MREGATRWTRGVASACLLLLPGCDSQYVYFPAAWEPGDWAGISGLPIEDVAFKASDGTKLHGWAIPAGKKSPWLLFCHGNAGNIVHRLDHLAALHRHGISVFIFDYRGYGRSAGVPSEAGFYRDAAAAYDALTERYQVAPQQLVLFGESLGSAVAADLATQRQAAGLILEAPFSSVTEMFKAARVPRVLRPLIRARYELVKRMPRVRMPVLVIHGDRDDIVPTALGRQVFEAAASPKELYLVPRAGHNDLVAVGGEAYCQRLSDFVVQVTVHGS